MRPGRTPRREIARLAGHGSRGRATVEAWTTTRFDLWSLDWPERIPRAGLSSSGRRSWPKAPTPRPSSLGSSPTVGNPRPSWRRRPGAACTDRVFTSAVDPRRAQRRDSCFPPARSTDPDARATATRPRRPAGRDGGGRRRPYGPLEFSQPSQRRGAQAIHLGPVQVIALAAIASFDPQIFDTRRPGRHSPRLRASCTRSRASCSGSVRRRKSPMFSRSRTAWR